MTRPIDAIVLGLIEGLTEFLPVSSTGHLLLAERFLAPQSDLFNVVIQAGAVLAVLTVFAGRIASLWRTRSSRQTQRFVLQVGVAFGITAVGGLYLKHAHVALPETIRPVAWATLIGGILFVIVELLLRRSGRAAGRQGDVTELSWAAALAQGAGQLVAAVAPGASRSGTTILLALMLGAPRAAATEFSFLLGIPTLLSASALKIFEAYKSGSEESVGMVLLAGVVAALVATVVVRWLLTYVQRHTFVVFGVYRIVLGIGLLLWAHERPYASGHPNPPPLAAPCTR